MVLGIAILLVIGMAVYVATPLLSPESPGEGALPIDVTPLTDLKRRRMVVYENLQDLEFEYKAGKVSREDYEALRENHLGEAAQLMLAAQEQEEVTENDVIIERQVATRRAQRKLQPHDSYTCPECGFENPLPVKFCGNCGTKLPQHASKK
ncbi:MAG: zinc-ribbon domain-containing protein [Acidobacteria bacterium]|nr:zinc-ribbon domain-containing protein [Acidobacteriota bacterium]